MGACPGLFVSTDKYLNIGKSICKIICPKSNGIGFFLKLSKGNSLTNFLFTNASLIKNEIIESKEKITIFYGSKNISIKLDNNERFIQNYEYLNIDITVIEILNQDNIKEKYFTNVFSINDDFNFIESENKEIIIYYYLDNELKYANGINIKKNRSI